MSGRSAVAIDLGGTQVKYGLVDDQGAILKSGSEPTGPLIVESVLERLSHRIRILAEDAAGLGLACVGAGVAVPGGIYEDRATISQSPNFPGWIDVDVKTPVSQAAGMPVFLENDANAAAVGEHWRGAGMGYRHLLLFTLGTGVGGGLILDGRLWRGAWGMAGEAGHINVDPEGPECGCGSRGCVESLASATRISAMGRAAVEQGLGEQILKRAGGDVRAIDSRVIADAARWGDPVALSIFEGVGEVLGRAAADALNLLNLELFIIGGGVSPAFDLIEPAMRREMRARSFRIPGERARLAAAKLGNDAGLVGVARLAMEEI